MERIRHPRSRERRNLSAILRFLILAIVVCYHGSIISSCEALKWVSREEWGADPPVPDMLPPEPDTKGVKIHYTGVYEHVPSDHSDCLGKMKSIQTAHLSHETQDYSDIAYNLGVCQHGYVLDGRGYQYRSGANGDAELNKAHYSILALIGDTGDSEPSADMVQGLKDAITYLRQQGAGNEILGHRDGRATLCPGEVLYQLVTSGALEPGAPNEPTSDTPAPDPTFDAPEPDTSTAEAPRPPPTTRTHKPTIITSTHTMTTFESPNTELPTTDVPPPAESGPGGSPGTSPVISRTASGAGRAISLSWGGVRGSLWTGAGLALCMR
jgi:hypothetical protein